jgi:hypothetical protein
MKYLIDLKTMEKYVHERTFDPSIDKLTNFILKLERDEAAASMITVPKAMTNSKCCSSNWKAICTILICKEEIN